MTTDFVAAKQPVFVPHLRHRIAIAIQDSGMTQTEIAQKLGLTQSSISKWVRGTRTPDIHQFVALAEITGCDWILDLHDLPVERRTRSGWLASWAA